jgi:aminoglycoside phosphotransferase family enzyme
MHPQLRGTSAASFAESCALVDKVQFLGTHAAYGKGTIRIENCETHMSWLFTVDGLVFKLKKPVRYPFLDFSTVAAREQNCRAEVHLNARLAPGVYLGVVPLRQHADGRFTLGDLPADHAPDCGLIVDWLVKMRRLPPEQMLDYRMARGTLEPGDVDSVANLLARFYRAADASPVEPAIYAGRFAAEQAINREVLMHPRFESDRAQSEHALDRLDHLLQSYRALLLARARDGRVVDGHGDLRPEHVCLLDPPVIIDCLEFNSELRRVDPFDELVYLGLECDIAGAPWVGPRIVERLSAVTGDRPPATLLSLYAAYRALLRARLCLAHLLEPASRVADQWIPKAQRYVRAAVEAMAQL